VRAFIRIKRGIKRIRKDELLKGGLRE